ncbi:phosphate ABC transporter permease PstA [Haladaptatus sp. DFWS20]|uniref:phosphate ABC transporter permease PstA n=1 Tax=Haladaptatus sp. DFWS20 TaxID=3403467 RepID=UPI003EBB6545
MNNVQRTALVSDNTTAADGVASGIIAVGFLVFVTSWMTLFQWVGEGIRLLGVSLFQLLGLGLLLMGFGIAGIGLASRYGAIDTEPAESAGLLVGVTFGLIGLTTGGLVGSHVLGLGTAGGVVTGLVLGLGTAAVAVVSREDIGSTLPSGVFLALVGVVFVAGIIDAGWSWSPKNLSVTLIGPVIVPTLAILGSLVGVWSAAKPRSGFGARGRQSAAFLLIGVSVFGMLAVLGLLVAFIVINGLDTVLTDVTVGLGTHYIKELGVSVPMIDVVIPFVMNVSQSLFVDVPGVLPAIVGTLWLVVGAVVFAVPLGVGAAVFLTEYADEGRFTQVVEIATNGLWSTPSIVFGLFGLAFLLPRVSSGRKSLLGGQLVLGFMLLPLVVITSREAIKAVPDEYRDASAALGVSKWQTIRSVVLPAAMPGIITGIILGVGRIAGETAPLLLTYGGAPFANSTPDVLGSFELSATPPFVTNEVLMTRGSALPYQLYTSITSGRLPGQGAPFSVTEFGWGTALVLLLVVLGLYAIGIGSRLYFRRKLHHE